MGTNSARAPGGDLRDSRRGSGRDGRRSVGPRRRVGSLAQNVLSRSFRSSGTSSPGFSRRNRSAGRIDPAERIDSPGEDRPYATPRVTAQAGSWTSLVVPLA